MNLSTRLGYLFGSEEYVDMRRQLVLLRETLFNYEYRGRGIFTICSGSLGEGLSYPTSDDDLMRYDTCLRVVQAYREATQIGDVLMVPSDSSPGYCLLLDLKESYPVYLIQIINEMPFFSSSLWKQFNAAGFSIHGPCNSGIVNGLEFDLCASISIYGWPEAANDWLLRDRYWPSLEIIQNIIQKGCHVVPVGAADSPYCQHEWRISFSVAERTLMHSFNHTQFLVYNLLRLTLKRILGKMFPEVLCSYFMKTTLFYASENTSSELWRERNIENCFKSCISVLYHYIDHKNCPNYFMPEYNMIKRKINSTNRQPILDIIRFVYSIGIIGVLYFSRESHCLDDSLTAQKLEWKLDRNFMFSAHMRQALVRIDNFFSMIPNENVGSCRLNLYQYWRLLLTCIPITGGLIDIAWNIGICTYSLKMMDNVFTSFGTNKQKMHNQKDLHSLLRIGFRANITIGKLSMATYLYMVGKTESALSVIRQLLSEYPPYAMDDFGDQLKVKTYVDVMCGRGYSLDYKIRRAFSRPYLLHNHCLNAFPSSMNMSIAIQNGYHIDPLTYAYFLESLCHVQHQNQRLLMKSLRCIVHHLENDPDYVVDNQLCVGMIKYEMNDKHSACRWFGSTYITNKAKNVSYKEKLSQSALAYIACLLKRHFR